MGDNNLVTSTTTTTTIVSSGVSSLTLSTPQIKNRCNKCSRLTGNIHCSCKSNTKMIENHSNKKSGNTKKRSPINSYQLDLTLRSIEEMLLNVNSVPPPLPPPPQQQQQQILKPDVLEASISRARASLHIFMANMNRSEKSYNDLILGTKIKNKKCNELENKISQIEKEITSINQKNVQMLCDEILKNDNTKLSKNIPNIDYSSYTKNDQLYCNAKMKRFITVNNIQYNMNESNDMNDLIKLAERDLNVYKLIQRKFKARQRWYLADTLCCMNAISYIKDESLFIFEDKYKLNDNKNIKRRGNRGGRGARGKKKI
jgi:hypothetical protein